MSLVALHSHLSPPLSIHRQGPMPPMATKESSFVDDTSNALYGKQKSQCKPSEAMEEFEFRTLDHGRNLESSEMCNADDVFLKGQILPLRHPSAGSQFQNSTSSQSSSSRSSGETAMRPRTSVSNNFFAHPSPKPQVGTSVGSAAARRSTGSAPTGWALFRVGLMKTPEIELHDLRLRATRSVSRARKEKKGVPLLGCACSPEAVEPTMIKRTTAMTAIKKGVPLLGCACSPDVVEPTTIKRTTAMMAPRIKKERESVCKSRTVEWLEELCMGKGIIGR